MPDFEAMFSTFGVDCINSEKPFYGSYPFKIMINDPVPRPVFPGGFYYSNKAHQRDLEEFRQARQIFMRKRCRTITAAKTDWRWMDNNGAKTISYFFKNAEDAMSFCEKNKTHIKSITRPLNLREVEVHNELGEDNAKLVVRDTLFWNKYRYCIHIKKTDEARDAADDFWANHVKPHADLDRAMYNFDRDRRLYLNDARDVFYARMGIGQYFKTFQKAILKSEIPHGNEPEPCSQAD